MSVNLDVNTSVIEKYAENEQLKSLLEASEKLLRCCETYVEDCTLSGKAYSSQKDYFESMQIPTIKGIIEFCEIMCEANKTYAEIVSSYFQGMHINDVLWEDILAELKNQYNSLTAHYESCVMAQMPGFGYEPYTTYGNLYGENTYIIDSLKDEINVLYTVIEEYQRKLDNLDEMNGELLGVYYHAKILQESVQAAVDELGSIHITGDGNYILDYVDRSVFEKLSNDIVAVDVANYIKAQLGEDILIAYAKGELSDEETKELMIDVAQSIADYSLSLEVTTGRLEIPIVPGMTAYLESTLTADLAEDEILGLDISREKGGKYLASADISLGMFEGSYSAEGIGAKFEEVIDENSTFYGELVYSTINSQTTLEIGVDSTFVDGDNIEVITTLAAGVELSPIDSDWQPDEKEQSSGEEVEAPSWEVSVEKQDEDSVVEDIHPIQAYAITEFGYVKETETLGTTSGLVALAIHSIEGNPAGVIWSLLDLAY